MSSFNELRDMYDRGQTEDVLNALNSQVVDLTTDEGRNLATLRGWCHYRRKEFDKAHAIIISGVHSPWARELAAYLYAYAPDHVNDEGLRQIAEELSSSNINIANAFVIRSRAKDCSLLNGSQVVDLVRQFENDISVHAANLNHNAGRFFLEKPDNEASYLLAVKYLSEAIRRYGEDKNFHHRAAANFWKSHAYEKLGKIPEAIVAMEESVRLWDEQCVLDPHNAAFATSSDSAKKRLSTLKERHRA